MAHRTRARIEHWCQAPFSIAILPPVARFTVTHIADPGIDLFATAKRLQDPLVFLKGIELAAHWTDKGLALFNNEFHTIAGREADALTDFLRYGHLAFTTNGAGIFHLYSDRSEERRVGKECRSRVWSD